MCVHDSVSEDFEPTMTMHCSDFVVPAVVTEEHDVVFVVVVVDVVVVAAVAAVVDIVALDENVNCRHSAQEQVPLLMLVMED